MQQRGHEQDQLQNNEVGEEKVTYKEVGEAVDREARRQAVCPNEVDMNCKVGAAGAAGVAGQTATNYY